MKITVVAKTNAKNNSISQIGPDLFNVSVTATPIDGKANKAIIHVLSKYFKVPKTTILLHRGDKSKLKTFIIG